MGLTSTAMPDPGSLSGRHQGEGEGEGEEKMGVLQVQLTVRHARRLKYCRCEGAGGVSKGETSGRSEEGLRLLTNGPRSSSAQAPATRGSGGIGKGETSCKGWGGTGLGYEVPAGAGDGVTPEKWWPEDTTVSLSADAHDAAVLFYSQTERYPWYH